MKFSAVDTAFLSIFLSAICSATPIPNVTPEAVSQTVSQITTLTTGLAVASNAPELASRYALPSNSSRLTNATTILEEVDEENKSKLERRKGGGGKSSSSSSSSSSSGSGGRVSVPKTSTPKVSNQGGRPVISTSSGSRYIGGGSAPYSVGRTAPTRSGMGAPVIVYTGYYPGFWYYPYPLWYYPYNDPWQFHNQTTNVNETINVACVAQQYQTSSCDYVNDPDFISMVLGNGAWNGWNSSMATVQIINGAKTAVLNGTVANGTATITSWGVPSASVPSVFMMMAGMSVMVFMSL